MPFNATAFKVMIASPSDVPTERRIVQDVVAEWTGIHASDKAAVLLPVAWELHSAPEMGDRPQAIINKRLLADCDILIGIFWTRLGTSTGAAPSGTVEEIEGHLKAGKPAMLYFSQAPVRPDSIDPKQYEAVQAFKKSCETRGLCESYDSLEDFRAKLSRQLAVTMIRACAERPQEGGSAKVEAFPIPIPTPVKPAQAELSEHATELLREVGNDKNGTLMRVNVLGGAIFQTNGRVVNQQGDARDKARWDEALNELERKGLICATGPKREVFQLTHQGFSAADGLAAG